MDPHRCVYVLCAGAGVFVFATVDAGLLQVTVRCDDMDLGADIVQDIARFFAVTELEAEVNYPREMNAFEEVSWWCSNCKCLQLFSG